MTSLNDGLPDVLKNVSTRPLFLLRLKVPPLYVVGATPGAFRRIGVVQGGSFEGARLSGAILDGGNDWQAVRGDGCTKLDVRILLKTTDDALIVMTYQALRHGPPNVMEELDRGEIVDPASYPTAKIGENSRAFRQLGLGYANLGAHLMADGVAYDSDAGRGTAAAIR